MTTYPCWRPDERANRGMWFVMGRDGRDRSPAVAEFAVECAGVTAGYGDLPTVRDLSLAVRPGEIVALLGPNGAGKTTALLALTGELPLMSGTIKWEGQPIRPRLHRLAKRGLAWVPDDRGVLMTMSVRDNLRLGRGAIQDAVSIFPELGKLLNRAAGLISGGEQQMLALGRALASNPSLLLLDELSLGLAPIAVDRLFTALRSAVRERSMAVLLVEQQARRALEIADRWYLLTNGRLATEGDRTTNVGLMESLYLAGGIAAV